MNIAIHVNSTDNCGRPHWQYTLHYWINTLLAIKSVSKVSHSAPRAQCGGEEVSLDTGMQSAFCKCPGKCAAVTGTGNGQS